jgi:hypothetical protein
MIEIMGAFVKSASLVSSAAMAPQSARPALSRSKGVSIVPPPIGSENAPERVRFQSPSNFGE